MLACPRLRWTSACASRSPSRWAEASAVRWAVGSLRQYPRRSKKVVSVSGICHPCVSKPALTALIDGGEHHPVLGVEPGHCLP